MARILITDGEQRSALAATRSLGRAGHDVYVASHKRASLAGASRYAHANAVVPDPLTSAPDFVNRVAELVDRWEIDLLLPVTEAALLALLPERERINAKLPFPSASSFARLCDKEAVAVEAARLGIHVPRTVTLRTRAGSTRDVSSDLSFPVVVKPHRSVTGSNGRRAKGAVMRAQDGNTLEHTLNGLPPESFPVLLQEQINGPGVGIFVLLHDGELLAAFAHRRIREKPPWGGVSVYRESIAMDQDLLSKSVALLRSFDFEGAAMIEYKVDAASGDAYIMEINGRLWGSLQLAIDAGVDFPALLAAAALDGAAISPGSYRIGTRSRWFWGDVDNLLLQLRSSDSHIRKSSSLHAVGDFIAAFGPSSRSEILRLTDPMPALRETIDWFAALRGRS